MLFISRIIFRFVCILFVLVSAYLGLCGAVYSFESLFGIDLNSNGVDLGGGMLMLAVMLMAGSVALSCFGALAAVVIPLSIAFPALSKRFGKTEYPSYVTKFVSWYANGIIRQLDNKNA